PVEPRGQGGGPDRADVRWAWCRAGLPSHLDRRGRCGRLLEVRPSEIPARPPPLPPSDQKPGNDSRWPEPVPWNRCYRSNQLGAATLGGSYAVVAHRWSDRLCCRSLGSYVALRP